MSSLTSGKRMPRDTMLVCVFPRHTPSVQSYSLGHPFPHPHLVNEKPQVGGKRAGLLSAFPRTLHEETFLRGAWPTDRNGVAQFTSALSVFDLSWPSFSTERSTLHVRCRLVQRSSLGTTQGAPHTSIRKCTPRGRYCPMARSRLTNSHTLVSSSLMMR